MSHGRKRVMSVMQWNPAIWISDGRQFATEVKTEFKKITWPSQKEAVGGTIGVVVIVAVITLALSLVDAVLGKVVQLVLG
jgi:preprotein translocase subunit SecE